MPAEAFDDNELERLAAFRDVARQVRDSSIMNEGRTIKLTIFGRKRGEPIGADTSVMLPMEPLRSLVMAIRLAYQKGPARFSSICGVLRKGASPTQIERIDQLGTEWRRTLEGPQGLDYILDGERFTAGKLFHHWINGLLFHQDPDKKKIYDKLDEGGGFAQFGCQGVALRLAGRILDLDDVIAEILDQEPVERIKPRARID